MRQRSCRYDAMGRAVPGFDMATVPKARLRLGPESEFTPLAPEST